MSATGALVWWSRDRPHTAWLAAWRISWAPAGASGTAWASTRASSRKSTVCHGVSVPPQSKITASTAPTLRAGTDRPDRPADHLGHPGHDVVDGDLLALAGRPV